MFVRRTKVGGQAVQPRESVHRPGQMKHPNRAGELPHPEWRLKVKEEGGSDVEKTAKG